MWHCASGCALLCCLRRWLAAACLPVRRSGERRQLSYPFLPCCHTQPNPTLALLPLNCPPSASMPLPRRCRSTDDREACAELTQVTFWFALWYTSFCILSTAVCRRTKRMRLLLNPVSSGVVQL